MRQHGAAMESKRQAAEEAADFLAEMQQAARGLRAELAMPDYKPIRGFAPRQEA